jgi:hypothetical protein
VGCEHSYEQTQDYSFAGSCTSIAERVAVRATYLKMGRKEEAVTGQVADDPSHGSGHFVVGLMPNFAAKH